MGANMQTDAVSVLIDDRGVATVTLDRPEKHNAFDDGMIADLATIFKSLTNNESVRAVILASTGKSFSAGADLNWMKRMAQYSYEENLADASALAEMLRLFNYMPKLTIARIQGATFGGAVGLVSCCDVAVASENASFCLSEVKIGILPATISPYVVAAIGQRSARRYFTTAERFFAQEAKTIGLVHEVVEKDQLDTTIDKIIGSLLQNGPKAVTAAKQLVFDVAIQPQSRQLIKETCELIASVRASDEGQEGLEAFLAKRPANWIRDN